MKRVIIIQARMTSTRLPGKVLLDLAGASVLERVVRRRGRPGDPREDIAYWLGRSLEDRISAVEFLRIQAHGRSARLQRVARVVRRTES